MVYRLIQSREATRELAAIFDYSATQWGIAQAERYVKAIDRAMQRVAVAPFSYPVLKQTTHRVCYVQKHAVIFKIANETVLVITILHQQMDIQARLVRLDVRNQTH